MKTCTYHKITMATCNHDKNHQNKVVQWQNWVMITNYHGNMLLMLIWQSSWPLYCNFHKITITACNYGNSQQYEPVNMYMLLWEMSTWSTAMPLPYNYKHLPTSLAWKGVENWQSLKQTLHLPKTHIYVAGQ